MEEKEISVSKFIILQWPLHNKGMLCNYRKW